MKVVKVLWVDSCNSNMNWTAAEDIKVEPMYINSFGVVVKDTDDFLTIAQNYGNGPEQYSNITTIPKGCIKEVFVIHEDNVCEKEQKPAWSEKDKQHIDSLLKRLEGLCRNEFESTRFAISEDVDWLKFLKDRVQPKQELKNIERKSVSITDEWIEDYWQHEKVKNPYSYDKGEEIQFDHQGFVKFCKKYCKKTAEWPCWPSVTVSMPTWGLAIEAPDNMYNLNEKFLDR